MSTKIKNTKIKNVMVVGAIIISIGIGLFLGKSIEKKTQSNTETSIMATNETINTEESNTENNKNMEN